MKQRTRKLRIGIIGLGKMGEALARGLIDSQGSNAFEVIATTKNGDSAERKEQELGLVCTTNNRQLVKASDVVILCVKPYQARETLKDCARAFRRGQTLISICAAISHHQLSEWSGRKPSIIRAMPNLPCLIRKGMTVLSPAPRVNQPSSLRIAQDIFHQVGQVCVLDEGLLDGVTGLSGCGPAFVFLMIEALSEAGVKVGIPRSESTLLAAQTMAGAAGMVLEQGRHPASLKDEVTTPAGCTTDGLMALEEGKMRATLIKAVVAAAEKSATLRKS